MAPISEKLDKFFDEKMKEYPTSRSFLVPMLLYSQDEVGFISDEVIAHLAKKTGLTELEVRNVISYYSMLRTRPAGKFNVQLCTNMLHVARL
jgi:NADH-quinone oxidoreductase subunit E